ncbi:MAG: RHS repeat domain-containing protein, partial [Enterobacteriaceae bacterium]
GTDSYQYRWDSHSRLREAVRTPTEQGAAMGLQPHRLQFNYDALGLLHQEESDDTVLTFHHDRLGNLTELTLPQGDSLRWHYYGRGHMLAVRHNDTLLSEFTRDMLHREFSRTQGNLVRHRHYMELDNQLRIFSQSPEETGGYRSSTLWHTWQFNERGQVEQTADHLRGITDYLYDDENRLTGITEAERAMVTFSYDNGDNRLDPSLPQSQQPGVDNRLHQWQGWHYRYDDYGNLSERSHVEEQQQFLYDGDNRLVEVSDNKMTAHYHYDALGRRVRKTVQWHHSGQSEQTDFVWQGLRLLQSHNRQTGVTQTYCYEAHNSYSPLACIEQQGEDTRYYWYHCDLNSTPLDITDKDGNIIWSVRYTPFGELEEVTVNRDGIEQNLRYAGQYFDAETGLHYNTFRFFDPVSGRYTQPDPIGLMGGVNLYQYSPNPIQEIDPLGLATCVLATKGGIFPGVRDHASLFIERAYMENGQYKQAIYDPSGSYARSIDPGNGDILSGGNASIKKYMDFYKSHDNSTVDVTCHM